MIRLLILPFLALALLIEFPAFGADYQKGVDAHNRGDYATALKEMKPLAEQRDAKAQTSLGYIYYKGQGVPQDYTAAVKWYRLAAEQGLADAQSNLGLKYDKGQGVLQDYAAAVKWFRLAAEQGSARALSNLGGMYYKGHGVPQDYVLAHMWANIAASKDYKSARKNLDIVEKIMTPAQIGEAQRLAREWVAKHQK